MAQFLKEQHIPVRTIARSNIRYNEEDFAAIAALGRTKTMAIVVHATDLTVAVNRFRGIQHVFVLASKQRSSFLPTVLMASLTRPRRHPKDIHVTFVYPDTATSEAVALDMGCHRIVFDI